jgi:putative membrane protein
VTDCKNPKDKGEYMIKLMLQGMVVGLANIIPGVSGGTMMVAMGIYDKLIASLTHLRSQFKKSLQFLLPVLFGAALAILILARLFEYLLGAFPIETNFAFCGLIVGSLPFIYKHVQDKLISPSMAVCFAVFFVLVAGMAFFNEDGGSVKVLSLSLGGILILFLIGVIAAATMVIPGVSGSMVLMLLGYYEPVLALVNDFIDALRAFEMSALIYNTLLLIPFGLGVLIGIFAIAKVIEILLKKWPYQSYWAIIGLIVASPIAILLNIDWSTFSFIHLLFGLILFGCGWFASSKLGGE